MFETYVYLKKTSSIDATAPRRIIDTACRLFASHGFDGINLRELTKTADVNLAAIGYYFGGKEALFFEVVRQRIRPLQAEQRTGLAQAGTTGGGPSLSLDQTLAAFLRPILDACGDPTRGGPAIARLYARLLAESPSSASQELGDESAQTLTRLAQSIRRHVPRLPPDEFLWRFTFVVGAMQHALANLHQMSERTRGICGNNDCDRFLGNFVKFSANVFAAPMREAEKRQN